MDCFIFPDSKFPACYYQFDKSTLLDLLYLLRKASSDFTYVGNVCHVWLYAIIYNKLLPILC